MDLIQERNSRSEEGIDSDPSKNLVSNEMVRMSNDLVNAKNNLLDENKSVQQQNLVQAPRIMDSCSYINNLGIVDSMNSNDLQISNQRFINHSPKREGKILYEKENKKYNTKKEESSNCSSKRDSSNLS
jgi:hypothetical protein